MTEAEAMADRHTDEAWSYALEGGSDRQRVSLSGEIDVSAAPLVRQLLLDAVRRAPLVEVDLAEVTFLDSAGISTLVAANNAAVANGHRFVVTSLSPRAHRVLEITGLLDVLSGPTDR